MVYKLMQLVPMFFRDKWPLKKYYWQKEELQKAENIAKRLSERIKWE